MTLVGFERLGMEDVPGASWVVPSAMKSKNLRDIKSTIDRCLDKPVAGDDEQDPRELLRRVGNDTRDNYGPTGDVDFGSESEGEDTVPDELLFPPNPRSKSNALDELKKSRKKRGNEHSPLDDETLEQRRLTREENAQARNAKIKSDLYIRASDEESNADDDEEFFRLEEERRKDQAERIKKALMLGRVEEDNKPYRRKRKSGQKNSAAERKRQRQSPPSAESEDDDILMTGVRTPPRRPESSPHGDNEDTPPTPVEDDLVLDDDLAFSRDRQKEAPGSEDQGPGSDAAKATGDADEEEPVTTRRPTRGGFVIESDSE